MSPVALSPTANPPPQDTPCSIPLLCLFKVCGFQTLRTKKNSQKVTLAAILGYLLAAKNYHKPQIISLKTDNACMVQMNSGNAKSDKGEQPRMGPPSSWCGAALALLAVAATTAAVPSVRRDAVYAVNVTKGVVYAQGL